MLHFITFLCGVLLTNVTGKVITQFGNLSCIQNPIGSKSKVISPSIIFYNLAADHQPICGFTISFGKDFKIVVSTSEANINVSTVGKNNVTVTTIARHDVLAVVQTNEWPSQIYIFSVQQDKEQLVGNISVWSNFYTIESQTSFPDCHTLNCPDLDGPSIKDVRYVAPTKIVCEGYGVPPQLVTLTRDNVTLVNTTSNFIGFNEFANITEHTYSYTYTCQVIDATGAIAQRQFAIRSSGRTTSYRGFIYGLIALGFFGFTSVIALCLYFKKRRENSKLLHILATYSSFLVAFPT